MDWAKGVIKTVRDFVRWLHRSDFDWKKPSDYEVLPSRVKKLNEEKAIVHRVPRYKRDEVGVLWEYGGPVERVWMLLALNCGFGISEISTLRLDEIIETDAEGEPVPPRIDRRRTKTETYMKWRLWPETVTALKWFIEKVRPESESPYVFVNRKGKPLASRTKGGNRNGTIPNAWNRVYARIKKDKATFPKKSFNKLRKTGSNLIRKWHGKEIADMHLGHGRREVVDAYTDKPYRLLYRAISRLRRFLLPAISTVSDAFPDKTRQSNPSLSLATRKRIKQLRDQGYTLKGVAEAVGVTIQTVQRYAKG